MWKKLFRLNKEIKETNIKKPVSITFEIDENNQFSVDLSIGNRSLVLAENLGLLLFLINEGYYVQSFLDILVDISKQHHDNAIFAQTTISHWSNKIMEHDQDQADVPIIKPSQFGVVK